MRKYWRMYVNELAKLLQKKENLIVHSNNHFSGFALVQIVNTEIYGGLTLFLMHLLDCATKQNFQTLKQSLRFLFWTFVFCGITSGFFSWFPSRLHDPILRSHSKKSARAVTDHDNDSPNHSGGDGNIACRCRKLKMIFASQVLPRQYEIDVRFSFAFNFQSPTRAYFFVYVERVADSSN